MNNRSPEGLATAIILVDDPAAAIAIEECFAAKGISARFLLDPGQALEECKNNPVDLVIVEDRPGVIPGIRFIARLIEISWTTQSILIAEEEPEALHVKTEGLGVLGSIRDYRDRERLEALLETFMGFRTPGSP